MAEELILLNEEKSKLLWNRLLEDADDLPALPDIVNKVLEQIENPNSSPKDFQDIISKDPVLTAKVLKMANSAYYGFSRKITTISQAIIILGLETLKSLVIAVSTLKYLHQEFDGYGYFRGDLWRHSLATAIGAKQIAKAQGIKEAETPFIAGLLHDIGKILLGKRIGKYMSSIKTIVKNRDISFDIGEKEVLRFNHADIGGALAEYWKLPQVFIDVCKFHHTPLQCTTENLNIVKIIHVADGIAYKTRMGLGEDGEYYKVNQEVLEEFGIDKKKLGTYINSIKKDVREFERALF